MPAAKDTKLYDLLGVAPTASDDEIRKAFKRAAIRTHPDRNPGDPTAEQTFKEINNAYEVLTDAKKRKIYDEYGQEGLEAGGNPDAGAGGFFGFGGGRRGPQRTQNVPFSLSVGLEDLYNGKTARLKISRKRVCVDCAGKGTTKPGVDATCGKCRGSGQSMRMIRQGNMVQQFVGPCDGCRGTGSVLRPEDACTGCKGTKTVPVTKEIEVVVTRGMRAGQQIVFPGEADEAPDVEPGDVIVTLTLESDEVRARKRKTPPSPLRPMFSLMGDSVTNLLLEREIELIEALGGWTYTFEHYDGRLVTVVSPANAAANTGDLVIVPGEGMPKVGDPAHRGDLYIKLRVRMPRDVSPALLAALRPLLPAPAPAPELPAGVDPEVVEAGQFSAAVAKRLQEQQEEDEAAIQAQEEELAHAHGRGHGGAGPQCAQM